MHSVPQHVSSPSHSPFYLRGDENGGNGTHIADLQQSAANAFYHVDAFRLSTGSMDNGIKPSNFSSTNFQFGGLSSSLCSSEIGSSSGTMCFGSCGGAGFLEVVADHSHQTGFSTNTVDKKQHPGVHNQRLVFVDSTDKSKAQTRDKKALSKLAQNREAARKCRLRKKVYVQQLESNQQKLIHLEQEIMRTRQQANSVRFGFSSDQSQPIGASCVVFDAECTQWENEHQRLIIDLRTAVNSHLGDNQLQLIVEAVMSHFDELFQIKRSQVLGNKIEPLTEQQLVGICNLQQSSQQAEDALSQGVEALQQSIVDTLSYDSLAPPNAGKKH